MNQYTYHTTVLNADGDFRRMIKPSALFRYVEQAAADHARAYGMDDAFFKAHHTAFLVGKQAAQITRMPLRAENLTRLHNELIHKDWFQTLPDFNAYVVRKGQALSDYACDPMGWRRKCLVNIAKAGMFSSDRTIAEYDRDIWHLGK